MISYPVTFFYCLFKAFLFKAIKTTGFDNQKIARSMDQNTTFISHGKILGLSKFSPKTNVAWTRKVVITGTSAEKC